MLFSCQRFFECLSEYRTIHARKPLGFEKRAVQHTDGVTNTICPVLRTTAVLVAAGFGAGLLVVAGFFTWAFSCTLNNAVIKIKLVLI